MIKGMLFSTVIAITLLPGAMFAQGTTLGSKQFDNGGVYEGAFRNGLQHGQGTFRMPNGYEYTGDWVDGEIMGQGVARFANGSVYEGSFAKGKPEGLGKITYVDGGTYEGSWLAGKITGQGVAIYANGARYEGGFREALHHGRGVLVNPDGYVYDGDWINGVKEGNAKITYPDGTVYTGYVLRGSVARQMPKPEAGLFLYSDDILYSLALRKAGWRIRTLPQMQFIHDCETLAAGDVYRPLWKNHYTIRNGVEVARVAAGWMFPAAIAYLVLVWTKRGLRLRGGERRAYFAIFARAFWHGLRRKRGRYDPLHLARPRAKD